MGHRRQGALTGRPVTAIDPTAVRRASNRITSLPGTVASCVHEPIGFIDLSALVRNVLDAARLPVIGRENHGAHA
jgi:hypothetical protein